MTSRTVFRFGHISRPTVLWLSSWLTKDLEDFKRMAMRTNVPKDTRFDTVCHMRSKAIGCLIKKMIQSVRRHVNILIDGKDAYNMQVFQDWNTFRWSRITLLSDPAAKLIRMKVIFSESTSCVGVSWRMCGSNMDLSKNSIWQPEKCNSFGTCHQALLIFKSRGIWRNT